MFLSGYNKITLTRGASTKKKKFMDLLIHNVVDRNVLEEIFQRCVSLSSVKESNQAFLRWILVCRSWKQLGYSFIKKIERVNLIKFVCNDSFINTFKSFSNLQHLSYSVHGYDIDDDGHIERILAQHHHAFIQNISNIKSLHLSHYSRNSSTPLLAAYSQLSNLKHLTVFRGDGSLSVGEINLNFLSQLKSLGAILNVNPSFSKLTKLEHFEFRYANMHTANIDQKLSYAPLLTSLVLTEMSNPSQPFVLDTLLFSKGICSKLEQLKIGCLQQFGKCHFLTTLKNLTCLSMNGCGNLTSVQEVITSLTSLIELDVTLDFTYGDMKLDLHTLSNITRLQLIENDHNIDLNTIASLKSLVKLQQLDLGMEPVNAMESWIFTQLTNLTKLQCGILRCYDNHFTKITQLKELIVKPSSYLEAIIDISKVANEETRRFQKLLVYLASLNLTKITLKLCYLRYSANFDDLKMLIASQLGDKIKVEYEI